MPKTWFIPMRFRKSMPTPAITRWFRFRSCPCRRALREIVHGIYCDEFAEWQIKDMPARQIMGSFVPSNGVGTGFTREALEKLANAEHNLIFEPGCLTEDYENGLRLHKLGCSQMFVPLSRPPADIVATREFFPRTTRSAIRQRTRWIMGIALQSWERHGWQGTWPQLYWFWRDRKALFGNPLSLFSNFLFLYGVVTWTFARGSPGLRGPWRGTPAPGAFGQHFTRSRSYRPAFGWIAPARFYGVLFALGVPIRTVCGNWINSMATFNAHSPLLQRSLSEPAAGLAQDRARLSVPERVSGSQAQARRNPGRVRLFERFRLAAGARNSTRRGCASANTWWSRASLTADELYEALSLQQSLPSGRLESCVINSHVARALPLRVIRDWKVLPFRISSGNMYLASPEIPTDELSRDLARTSPGSRCGFIWSRPRIFASSPTVCCNSSLVELGGREELDGLDRNNFPAILFFFQFAVDHFAAPHDRVHLAAGCGLRDTSPDPPCALASFPSFFSGSTEDDTSA